MARINDRDRFPQDQATIDDYLIGTDIITGKTRTYSIESILNLGINGGSGGLDTFATLNGNIITFPDSQTVDVTPVVDTDTNTFATLTGTIITLEDGSTIDVTQGNAVLNGNIITFGDGQTADITPVVDTDTNTFATLSGGTITFEDGQTLTIPVGSTDDQTASEVSVSPIAGIAAVEVQSALAEIFGNVPINTSQLTNDGSDGSNPFITSGLIDGTNILSNSFILTRPGIDNSFFSVTGTPSLGNLLIKLGEIDGTGNGTNISINDSLQQVALSGTEISLSGLTTTSMDILDINTSSGSVITTKEWVQDELSDKLVDGINQLTNNLELGLGVGNPYFKVTGSPFLGTLIMDIGDADSLGNGTVISIDEDQNSISLIGEVDVNELRIGGTNGNLISSQLGINFPPILANTNIASINSGVNRSLVTKEWVLDATLAPVQGTFIPTIVDDGGGATYPAVTAEGSYIKIGNQVTFTLLLNTISTTGTPSGLLKIGNLPFLNTSTIAHAVNIGVFRGISSVNTALYGRIGTGEDFITVLKQNGSSTNEPTLFAETLTNGAFEISGTYITS